MAINTTKASDLIIPEVIEEMVREELPHKLVFAELFDIDNTLEGVAGNTIVVPKFGLIGPAEDVEEGGEVPYEKMKTGKAEVTIKKTAKGVELTDEAMLSGYGKPLDEAVEQLSMAMAMKVDIDGLETLKGAKLKYNRKSVELDADVLADALTLFGERINVPRLMFITPDQYAMFRKSPKFVGVKDITGKPIIVSGVVGEIEGVQLTVTANKNIVNGQEVINIITEPKSLGLLMKRKPQVEKARNINTKITQVNADSHYGCYIKNDSKVLLLRTKKPTIAPSEEDN